MKSTHLPAPAQTVSPGRSVVAVSRIASAWEQERQVEFLMFVSHGYEWFILSLAIIIIIIIIII